ncbi:MAG: hypothetical protein JXB48_05285 [Candidatus Latescibacteria bacterium]|nr:hypothetical protein [Candidatus Latescibacterota bacterium]
MAQGRQAIYNLLHNEVSWPPVVVIFGLDPFGWHGERESYREVCDYALENCTLLPKVYPLEKPLFAGEGDIRIVMNGKTESDGTRVRQYKLSGTPHPVSMVEIQTPGDSSWKNSKRWIETDSDLEYFLSLTDLVPAKPDCEAVRIKEKQVGDYGLPYVEVFDPFYTVCEMFPTDMFFIKCRTDTDRIMQLLDVTGARIVDGITSLCRDTGCPFILRLVGAEMAVPPFMSRNDFLKFEGSFYRTIADITHRYEIPTAFHCHGPVRDIMDDIWKMGYNFIEPFEPVPRGNVTIDEALSCANGRGIVFGGIDDVIFNTGGQEPVRKAVEECLNDARSTNAPFILSQSATPFYDPLSESAKQNFLLYMELGTQG